MRTYTTSTQHPRLLSLPLSLSVPPVGLLCVCFLCFSFCSFFRVVRVGVVSAVSSTGTGSGSSAEWSAVSESKSNRIHTPTTVGRTRESLCGYNICLLRSRASDCRFAFALFAGSSAPRSAPQRRSPPHHRPTTHTSIPLPIPSHHHRLPMLSHHARLLASSRVGCGVIRPLSASTLLPIAVAPSQPARAVHNPRTIRGVGPRPRVASFYRQPWMKRRLTAVRAKNWSLTHPTSPLTHVVKQAEPTNMTINTREFESGKETGQKEDKRETRGKRGSEHGMFLRVVRPKF